MSSMKDREGFEYIGDSISVGYDAYERVMLVKEFSDGSEKSISLDFEVLSNFYNWLHENCPLYLSRWQRDIKEVEKLLGRR